MRKQARSVPVSFLFHVKHEKRTVTLSDAVQQNTVSEAAIKHCQRSCNKNTVSEAAMNLQRPAD